MLRRYLFYLVLLMMLLPLLQETLHVVKMQPLFGDFPVPEKPLFHKNDWLSGKFQEAYLPYLEQKNGFHNLFIRVNNQYDYSLFRQGNANDVVVGKDGYLLGGEYIRSYRGNDFIGEKAIDKKLRRLKYLQELLKTQGKELVLVLEPGKASFFPEKIPGPYYLKYPEKRSNYTAFTQRADALGIEYIDFNKWFKSMKASSPYPLYPRNGIHWSAYGAWRAADSLVKYIEKHRNIDLPDMVADSILVTAEIQGQDYDAANTLNLLCKLKNFPMPYPMLSFPGPDDSKQKVSVLTVGDSYYWNIFNTNMGKHLYKDESFWYFNAFVYPETYTKETKTDSLDLIAEVAKRDVIFVMVTEIWLAKLDFDFIDRLFDLVTPFLIPDYPYLFEGRIRRFTDWLNMVADKAVRNRIKLEDAIHGDALFTFRSERKEDYLLRYGPRYYQEIIESDQQWFHKEKEKAIALNTDLKTIIIRDSWYVFKQEYPDLCRKYYASLKIAQALKEDATAMQKIINNPWYLRPEEMLWQVAVARAYGKPQSLALMTW